MIAGLEAAYAHVFHGSWLPAEVTAALDVTARGSLAAWYSSLLLAMAAVNAVLVYWLRSHKLDDYRGRYRVWLWASLALFVAAVDAATGLHAIVGHLIADYVQSPWFENPARNALAALSLVFGILAARLSFEIWSSRLARWWLATAVAGYLTGILLQLEVLVLEDGLLAAMATSASMLVAHLAVALLVAAYCRYVHLESQGALKSRRGRRRRAAVEAAGETTGEVKSSAAGAKAKTTPSKQSAEVSQGADRKDRLATSGRPADKGASQPAPAQPAPAKQPARKKTLKTAEIDSKSIRCDAPHQAGGENRATAANAEQGPGRSEVAQAAQMGEMDFSDYDPETGEKLSKSERRRLRKQLRRQKRSGSG